VHIPVGTVWAIGFGRLVSRMVHGVQMQNAVA
jgi:hypothetical protein